MPVDISVVFGISIKYRNVKIRYFILINLFIILVFSACARFCGPKINYYIGNNKKTLSANSFFFSNQA